MLQERPLRSVDGEAGSPGSPGESLALRHREALAVCSRVLLSAQHLDEIDEALEALLAATDATSIFVELNVEDPELGPCSSLLREVSVAGVSAGDEDWTLVPWAQMPESFERLSRGETFAFLISSLGPVERASYERSNALSELDVPFFVDGTWVGLIGLSDDYRERAWRRDEIGLMVTAAEMVAAFWERRQSRLAAAQMVEATETALRYQRALVTSSRAILSESDDLKALRLVLETLTEATNVEYGFVERNEDVAGVGLCSRLVFEVDRTQTAEEPDPYWELVPWSRMPDSYSRLSRGEPFAFTLADLGPVERSLYESDPYPIASEIDIPIFVNGAWEGLVGFASVSRVRTWTPEETDLLATVADLIGVHWARLRAQEQMRELLEAKDAFLASVSHELRTPLTVVVGLAAELNDHPDRFPPEMVREFIGIIAQQSSDLTNIVEDLLVAARVDEDIHVAAGLIDLGIEVTSVIDALGLDGVATTGNAVAWADPIRVRQIVRNLLTNAERYGGHRVDVEITTIQDRAIVRVSDDGPGVTDALTDTLFEPYKIGHQEHTQPDAIGLGLFISKRLATLMGGDLRYAREDGRTVFSLAIPRHPAAA